MTPTWSSASDMTSWNTTRAPGTRGGTDRSSISMRSPRRSLPITSPKSKTIITSNGLSPMGIALPGGVAAKLMEPNRRVVTLSGDGGFLMSVHELETARRERAATVNLVFRDGGLGSIRWKQIAKFKRTVGTDFGNPDFPDLAKAFGVRGFGIDYPSELNSVLAEAFELNAPCVVDIPVDYGKNPFLDLPS